MEVAKIFKLWNEKPAYSCKAMLPHTQEGSTCVTSLHQGFFSHH